MFDSDKTMVSTQVRGIYNIGKKVRLTMVIYFNKISYIVLEVNVTKFTYDRVIKDSS